MLAKCGRKVVISGLIIFTFTLYSVLPNNINFSHLFIKIQYRTYEIF